jgi:hypothetical protein
MNNKKLHTYTLEKEFGHIGGQIIKQNKHIRIIHLKDNKEISRTLAIVRFLNTDKNVIKVAHSKIKEGGLLGKTFQNLKINFRKEFVGSLQVKLPEWLKTDFDTKQNTGFALFSKVLVSDDSLLHNEFMYAELIEIIPQDLETLFIDKTKTLSEIDKTFISLLKEADLTEINVENNYD